MTLSCDLQLELQGHRFELRSREASGSQLEVDFVIPGVTAMLALGRTVGLKPPSLPAWLRVHVWLGGTQLTTL